MQSYNLTWSLYGHASQAKKPVAIGLGYAVKASNHLHVKLQRNFVIAKHNKKIPEYQHIFNRTLFLMINLFSKIPFIHAVIVV